MRVSRTALSIGLALALSLPLVGSASAATTGSTSLGGHLVVSVWTADFRGTQTVDASSGTVTGTVTSGLEGVYSPNHQQIAYQVDNGPCVAQPEGGCAWQPDLMLSSSAGANPHILLSAIQGEAGDAYIDRPTWSPNSKQVYFDSPQGLGRINTDGTGFENLGQGADPAVSTDGSQLAFLQGTMYTAPDGTTQFGTDLYAMDLATRSVRQLTSDHQVQSTPPRWSPDGQGIVYATQNGVNVVNAVTGQVAGLYSATTSAVQISSIETPVYSPDGSQIAFSGYDAATGAGHLYAVAADGSNLRQVADSNGTLTEWIE
jgi:TolB protein